MLRRSATARLRADSRNVGRHHRRQLSPLAFVTIRLVTGIATTEPTMTIAATMIISISVYPA